MKRLLTLLLIMLSLSSCAPSPRVFSVLSLDISVLMKFARTQEEAYEYIDEEHLGAFYYLSGKYVIIADHRYQEFNSLPDIEVGTIAKFGSVDYICTGKAIGYSIEGLYIKDSELLPNHDLYAITCTGCEDYLVHIIYFDKLKDLKIRGE